MQHSLWRAPIYSPFSCKPFAVFSANMYLMADTPVLWFDLLAIFLLRLRRPRCFSYPAFSLSISSCPCGILFLTAGNPRGFFSQGFSQMVLCKFFSRLLETRSPGRWTMCRVTLKKTSNTSKNPVRRTLLRIWRLGYPQHDHQMYPLYGG